MKRESVGLLGVPFLSLPPVLTAAGVLILVGVLYSGLPAHAPDSFQSEGAPGRWTPRSFAGVWMPALVGFSVQLVMLMMVWLLEHRWGRADLAGLEEQLETVRRGSVAMMIVSQYMVALVTAAAALAPVLATSSAGGRFPVVAVAPPIAVLVLAVIAIWAMRVYRNRLPDRAPRGVWKLRQIYINPSDPAIVVPQRDGTGFTLNFGQRGALLVLGACVAVFLVPIGLMLLLQ